jgi:NADPH2 dehydrogenase
MNRLFTANKINSIEIKNRIVLPPMVCFTFSEGNGYVSLKNIKHYEAIARGGAGLIIVEATCVNKAGRLSADQLGIWADEFIPGLKQIADACHDKGAKVFIQLHHAGLKAPKSVTEVPITSSDYDNGKIVAKAMSKEELHALQKDFVEAAIRAEKAGFDGIELHGAHGYLMTQFFSLKINNRTDEYGGELENRIRFTLEIVDGIKKNVNKNFAVGIRMGCNENSLEESINIARSFEAAGMDFLHLSTGFDNSPIELEVPKDFPGNWIVYGATKIKEKVNIPVIAVNSIKTLECAEYLLQNSMIDFVAVGRGQLADYNFAKHLENGEEVVKCLECKPCKWFSNGDKCPRHLVLSE